MLCRVRLLKVRSMMDRVICVDIMMFWKCSFLLFLFRCLCSMLDRFVCDVLIVGMRLKVIVVKLVRSIVKSSI